MAIAAHPDDIEFLMAGTLLLLGQAGYELHYMNLASGNCGSMHADPARTRRIRRRESIAAAKILGATHHPSICDDLEIFYEIKTLRKLTATIRNVAPGIILTHSPQDYMEDHTNTSRLVVTAAFARGMPNFRTTPSRKPSSNDVAIYHAMPHGLRDQLRQSVTPELFVETTFVQDQKRGALAAHASQKEWLDATQGMDSYLAEMDAMSRQVGEMSGAFAYAEGWRRHLHLGFSAKDHDVLSEVLGASVRMNRRYNATAQE
jgi:LmbE family N-acetylglucosaminyl deacetylase